MKKSDLITGDLVVSRSGDRHYVFIDLRDKDVLLDPDPKAITWDDLDCYTEDLVNKTSETLTIMAVYRLAEDAAPGYMFTDSPKYRLIWDRGNCEIPKPMTVKEIEEELGYSISIVSEK